MAPPVGSAAARLAALRSLSTIMYLQALDDHWTAEISAMRSGEAPWSQEAAEDLGRLHDEMREGLHRMEESALELREMLEQLGSDQIEQAARGLGEASSLAERGFVDALMQSGLDDFDLRGAVLTACIYVYEEAATERGILTEKRNRVMTGDIPDGDFRLSFKCALYLAGVGACIAATIATGGAPLIVGTTVAGQAILAAHGWSNSGCTSAVPDISRGRR